MPPLTAESLRGNWATLLLPIRADDSIDFDLLAAEVDQLIAARVDGVYSNGSAGEFYAQMEDEFDAIHRVLAERCRRAGMPFQIGASHMSAQISLARLRRTRELLPSAFQVILPDWFAPSWEETIAFLETMAAAAAPVPLVLYQPPHAKRQLRPSELLRLADAVPGVIGLKVAGGDDAWFREMEAVFARLSVFLPGHTLARGLARGARGTYSNVACLSPRGAQRWFDVCQRDPAEGRRWQDRIEAFWLAHIAPLVRAHGLSNMAADKAAAAAGGWLPGLTPRLRWPYRSATDTQVRSIAAAARAEVPELF